MTEVSTVVVSEPGGGKQARPGRQLAAARERCGLNISDIAHQLKLSPSQVEAMEADDYQRLPGAVFVRGFIRNYARLVKLDPAGLLVATNQRSPGTTLLPESELPHLVNTPFPAGRELSWHKYAIGTLLALALLVTYEFYRDDAADISVTSRSAPPQPEIAAPEKVASVTTVPVAAFGEVPATPARPITAAQSKLDAGENFELSSGLANAEHKSEEHQLKLRFDQESWVEIRDRNGRRIFSQLNPAGTALAVSGLPPLSLVVGNAAGVHLIHNDQPVNLAPHIKIDVARLTLE